ncbi:MAG: hypothetical protein LLG02_12570 [Pelosinus sp.]|nr:hypothetical protein [Pelosinus sp.]
MINKKPAQQNASPIVKISLVNYDAALQIEYSKKFMSPLLEGLLKRRVKTKK